MNIDIGGSVTTEAEGSSYPVWVGLKGSGNTVNANIQGSLNAFKKNADDPEKVTGIKILHTKGTNNTVNISVGDGIVSDGPGIALIHEDQSNASPDPEDNRNTVIVTGDVRAKGAGIYADTPYHSVVVVDGTLSGGTAPAQLGTQVNDNLTLAAWKIEPDQNGAYIIGADGKRDTEAEKNILYCIRVNQPVIGAVLSTEGTTDVEGYACAPAGDTVYLVGDMMKGYQMVTAYWDEDLQKAMTEDGANRFCMTVPEGGGVTMTAVLQRIDKPQCVAPDYTVDIDRSEHFDSWIPVD